MKRNVEHQQKIRVGNSSYSARQIVYSLEKTLKAQLSKVNKSVVNKTKLAQAHHLVTKSCFSSNRALILAFSVLPNTAKFLNSVFGLM